MVKARASKKSSVLGVLIFRCWWVFVFFVAVSVFYVQSVKSTSQEIFEHKNKLALLEKQKSDAYRENEDLTMMVNSLSDPAWIEIILMRDLGVVPEGKIKVHFTTKEKVQ